MPSAPIRSRRRRGRLAVALVVGVLAGAALTACGSDDPTPAAEAQQRAQAGLLTSYTATYTLANTKGADTGTVIVWRTPSMLRLDVRTSTGTATSITTPSRTVACQKPESGAKATCLEVAGPGKTPPAALDPVLRKTFGDVLRVLAADDNGLTITGGTDDTDSAAGETARCFTVKAAAGAKIAAGTYCLTEQGIPTALDYASGSATLKSLVKETPAPASFVPETSPTPLPAS